MTMVGLPMTLFTIEEEEELPDNFVTLEGMELGFNDEDTLTLVILPALISEGTIVSIHLEDDTTSYQNTSGSDAFGIFTLRAVNSGTQVRHVKIWDSPNDDSITGATLRYETGQSTTVPILDATGETLTVFPIKISNNNYCVIENVDDARAGTNQIQIIVYGFFREIP